MVEQLDAFLRVVKSPRDWEPARCICDFFLLIPLMMACFDFSMNMVVWVGCRLGSSSQSSGSRSLK